LPSIGTVSSNKFKHDLTDKAVNGGYDITQVQFQVRSKHHDSSTSPTVITSDKIDLYDSSGDLQVDFNHSDGLISFDNDALLLDNDLYEATGPKELILEMYYLNGVYDVIAVTPDFTTEITVSNALATTELALATGFTTIDNSKAVIKFKRVQNFVAVQAGCTQAAEYTINLLAKRPELADGATVITYVRYEDGDVTETITDASYSAGKDSNDYYTHTFDLTSGLISGYKYTPEIVTTSKEQNGLLSTDDNYYQEQLALDTAEHTRTLDADAAYTVMPYDDPIITLLYKTENDIQTNIVSGFNVYANGSPIQDAILITSPDDISDLTAALITDATSRSIVYKEGGVAVAPPFKSYYKHATNEYIDFRHTNDGVVPNGEFFFLVTGIKGHYRVRSSNNNFYTLFT